jgi:hypothetical protein
MPDLTDPDAWLAGRQQGNATRQQLADPDAWMSGRSGLGIPLPPAGPPKTQAQTEEGFKTAGRAALETLPAAAATAAAIVQPEFIPAVGAAILGGAGGGLAQQGMKAAFGTQDAPQNVPEAINRAGREGIVQGAMEAGGRAIAAPLEKAGAWMLSPQRMYGRELRPSTTLNVAEANRRIQTGLQERIPVSGEGYEEVGRRVRDVTGQMEDAVRNSPQAQQQLVNPLDIANRLDALATNSPWAKQALNAQDVETLQSAKRAYLEKHGAVFDSTGNMTQPPGMMTPVQALEEKQATYAVNRQKYEAAQKGGAAVGAATDAAEKSLALGAKDQLIALYPELKALGERDAALLNLEDSLRQFVSRERNRNALGLRATILGGAALTGLATGSREAGVGAGVIGLALSALDVPEVKSKLAIALARAQGTRFGQLAGQATPTRVIPLAERMGRAIWDAVGPQTGAQ